jgi:hypothetical protein
LRTRPASHALMALGIKIPPTPIALTDKVIE